MAVLGWVTTMWTVAGEYSCHFHVMHGDLLLFKTEIHPGELPYEPMSVTIVPTYGPRHDVSLTHAML